MGEKICFPTVSAVASLLFACSLAPRDIRQCGVFPVFAFLLLGGALSSGVVLHLQLSRGARLLLYCASSIASLDPRGQA